MKMLTLVLALWAGAAEAAVLPDATKTADCLFDGSCGRSSAPIPATAKGSGGARGGSVGVLEIPARPALTADVSIPLPEPAVERGLGRRLGDGLANGGREGALLGFMGVLYPAVELISEGMDREMSRHYDGPRGDNGHAGLHFAGGIALAVVLYVPALAVGAAGAVLGAVAGPVAESLKPGSTSKWDAERLFVGGPR